MQKKYTPKEAKLKVAKFCSYQERCHQEVRDKLYAYGIAQDDVEEIIYELIQQDFLNEERYAIAYTRGKFNYKKWGKNKIRRELKYRKISEYCIRKGMAEITAEAYHATLFSILEKKIASLSNIKGYQKNYKAAQYAMGRGFESDLVWSVIKENFSV